MFAYLGQRTAWVAPTTAGVWLIAAACADEKQKTEPSATQAGVFSSDFPSLPTKEQVEALKKKYPFESLSARLKHEEKYRGAKPPILTADASRRLDQLDQMVPAKTVRAESLQMLHSLKVEEFISKSGVGISRLPRPGFHSVEPYVSEPIKLDASMEISSAEADLTPSDRLREDPGSAAPAVPHLHLMPSRQEIGSFHENNAVSFALPQNFGYVESRDRTAGFVLHGAYYHLIPPLDLAQSRPEDEAKDQKHWKVQRMQLVSLLKHDTPHVYLSEHLPRMEEISSATVPTRELSEFEAAALKKLRSGRDLQTSSTPNHIEMLGAVRAGTSCLQCHEVPRGTLLGAFSYDLRRDPPIKVPAAGGVQQ